MGQGRVRITDVSPRDGLQNERSVIATADKVRLVELLLATGVDEIEVSSFVSAKWVPQLGDAAEVFRKVAALLPRPEGGGGGVGPPSATWHSPPRSRATLARASALRKAATGPERELWSGLAGRRLGGLKFRRQHPFGPYVLDFFCFETLLAVEVDGRSHDGDQARDAERERWIAEQGVRVIRFTNDEVIHNRDGVLRTILRVARGEIPAERFSLEGRRSPTPQPPPLGRGSRTPDALATPRPMLSALVPNERGLQDALGVNREAGFPLIGKVSVFTAASETFSKRNTNATIAETLARFGPVIAGAHAEGLLVRGYVSCVIACPFEGPIAPEAVVEVSKRLLDLGVDEIDLGDTIGAGTAATTGALLSTYARSIPLSGGAAPTTLHLHDTFGRAAECVRAALGGGILSFDGSVAGLGGCPYAGTSQKPAPGNIASERLVRTVHDAGFATGVDVGALERAAAFARETVRAARAP